MSPKSWIALAAVIVAALVVGLPAGVVVARDIMDVMVLNFPNPQPVKGTVSIEGTIRQAELVGVKDIIVAPVKPSETTRLINGGTITADGYEYLVLSLTGLAKGDIVRPGAVGAFLIPDEESILRAFHEVGQIQFPLEVSANRVTGDSPYFTSEQRRHAVAFPRYRVYFYNTTDKTVTVNLFSYLTQ